MVEVEPDTSTRDGVKITGKIIDFGLSFILGSDFDKVNSQVSQVYRWRAPELANIDESDVSMVSQHMEKADVWSFSLTSLEVSRYFR